ncbi:hypothetical protein LAZ67_4000035 [Cordylochernes scorpioides]|uniref:Uncharacterized protein n=1 Tax=Cordylochernes scorpioides TaxID=51811 RepID=A0ABY6KB42_9ARAC|nr:hypothetical protein LAZ67_4000035 [Cordylochernes scorpioides]
MSFWICHRDKSNILHRTDTLLQKDIEEYHDLEAKDPDIIPQKSHVIDEKRVGRPILHRNPEKLSQISNLIKVNPRIGLRDIEEELKSLVGSIIKEDLQLKKTPSKFVPIMLTIQQKENRVEVAKKNT